MSFRQRHESDTRATNVALACLLATSTALAASCVGTLDPLSISEQKDPAAEPVGPAGPAGPPPPTPLRRLTRTEYNLTIRDLVGDSSNPGSLLVQESPTGMFDNVGPTLSLDDMKLERFDLAAEQVIENAMQPTSKNRKNLVTCSLATGGRDCALTSIKSFARRAWRRPLATDPDELAPLMDLYDRAASMLPDAEDGLKVVLRAILVSPRFLYRVESDPPGGADTHRVNPHELATRLSYFIYSSMPDPLLSAAADDGTLADSQVYLAQVARMTADRKADALATNFAAQWLNTQAILDTRQVTPSPKLYPVFDAPSGPLLRQAMQQETESLFAAFVHDGQRRVLDLLDADFTFVNKQLASHYKLPGVGGTGMQKVMLTGTPRGGLLTQGGMLTATSRPAGTSYAKRGKFIQMRLLCLTLGDPPKDADQQLKVQNLSADLTPKQFSEAIINTRSDCKGCHVLLNPIGFALEHFDPVGVWRDRYADGTAIDATGKLPDGTSFDGAVGLGGLGPALKQDGRFARCLAQRLFTFALGREPTEAYDRDTLEAIDKAYLEQGGGLGPLVTALAQSAAFTSRTPAP